MEGRISIITLGTKDMERSVAFYRDGLGWETDYKSDDGIAFFRLTGTWMGI
jgi:catechol 2,3-dioxygenase-like lactoylglutathione lyase family enzyme